MTGRVRRGALVACVWLAGCSAARPPLGGEVEDTPATWGDEYEGLLADTDLADADFHAARTAFAADALASGDERVVRATAAAGPVAARYRDSASGRAGAMAFNTRRLGVVVGAVRASLGEGALLADARDAASVQPRGARSTDGLRLAPSSSTWGSSPGAGVRVTLARVRLAAGAWRDWDAQDDARAFVSVGVVQPRASLYAAAGRSRAAAGAGSLCVAHVSRSAFVSGEMGTAADGARGVLRVIVGEGGAWRALFAAGAPSAAADPAPATPASRWGGALERRFDAGGVSGRAMLSSRTRRDGSGVQRRQRAECGGSLAAGGARLEVGVRATRESEAIAPDLLEGAAPFVSHDELRLRCSLRTHEDTGDGLRVEQSYRVEVIVSGSAPAGRVLAWTGRARWRALDARVHASAFDLSPGQLAYTGRAVLPGAATFTTLSRSGVDLSASLSVRLPLGAGIGVQGIRTAAGEARLVLRAAVTR